MSEDPAGETSSARTRIRAYYDALERGDPLAHFFADDESVVKFGISERLVGGTDVAAGLCEQTETTTDWSVDSRALRVTERDDYAWVSDVVSLAWTSTSNSTRYEFDTRWSGTLERRDEDGGRSVDGPWQFVGMHVSTAEDF